MLKKMVSIAGKPGLFKLIAQGKNILILESLETGKRQPALSRDKVSALGDIVIFTQSAELPLGEVFAKIKEKEGGKVASIDPKADAETLRGYLAEVVPDYDRDRVYPTDIRKIILWYNTLTASGNADFSVENEDDSKQVSE